MKKGCMKGMVAGTVVGVYAWLVGAVVWQVLFREETAYHAFLFRKAGDPRLFAGLIAGNLLIGLAMAFGYRFFARGISATSAIRRGVRYGIVLWLILGLGKGIHWYGLYEVSETMLAAYLIYTAAVLLPGGVMISRIVGDCQTCETKAA